MILLNLLSLIDTFGSFFGPIFGVIIVDYYLIKRENLESEGYFNSNLVRKIWEEHQNKKRDWQSILWPILIFQSWKKEN